MVTFTFYGTIEVDRSNSSLVSVANEASAPKKTRDSADTETGNLLMANKKQMGTWNGALRNA